MNAAGQLIITTLAANFDDFPWVELYKGIEIKLIHARPEENLSVVQIRAQPFTSGGWHRHAAHTFGFTTRGLWGHDPKEFHYAPNSYVCEPNELHRFHNGPGVSEAYYINTGDNIRYDPEGREEVGRSNAADVLRIYLEKCEAAGLPRPNIIG